jgi:imidazolonepropionase
VLKPATDAASPDRWTLIRGARQLLTLHGPTGPRRGPALKELNIIQDGALLIRNSRIEQLGPAKRVENLAQSRQAFEIDVRGGIVLPAFADPDAALVLPPHSETRLKVLSRRRVEIAAAATAADWVRAGTLSLGAHTGYAADPRDTLKTLRVHAALQKKPLRIRSILSPLFGSDVLPRDFAETLLPSIRVKKLATVLELAAGDLEAMRSLATAAAALGYSIRMRAKGPPDRDMLEFAASAGVFSIVAPSGFTCPAALADIGCVHVIPMTEALREDRNHRVHVRQAVEAGTPMALGSGYGSRGNAALNPQFLLHLACNRFGLTCEEAIVATTWNALCALRMSHVAGSLEPGKYADLVVMDVPDYRELARRVGDSDAALVMRAGQPVYRRAPLDLTGLKRD